MPLFRPLARSCARTLAPIALLASLSSLAGCGDPPKRDTPPPGVAVTVSGASSSRGAPPPGASAKVEVCKGGGGEIKDAESSAFFPRTVGGYCVNPDGTFKAFGEKTSKPINAICEFFDGGCEMYLSRGIKRTVRFDYVDGAGSPATVETTLSQFASAEHAFAMFSARAVGDEDPARADMWKPVEVGSIAGLGTGSLVAWIGPYLLELSYVNTDESGDVKKLKASGDRVLPLVAKDIIGKIAQKVTSGATPPAAVAKLPKENMIPLGITFALDKLLNVDGTKSGAMGHYKDGDKRYRYLVIARDDQDQAKDVIRTFAKTKGAQEEKAAGDGGIRLMVQEGEGAPKAEWLLARAGNLVVGVGDESLALTAGQSAAEHDKVSLSKDDKIKKLKAVTLLPTK